nr:MAG: ORF1 [TTV-like mini virus]
MPYYYRKRYYRRRPYFRWRTRRPFRQWRRRRYHRRYKVKKKLKKLHLTQFQPDTIRTCTVKGLQPLFITNKKTLSKNFRQWEHSLMPPHWPGGGGFSITKYSLEGLYEQFELDRNWWTKPNTNLPLVRYIKCTLKLYKSEDVDYVCHVYNCQPMIATSQLYLSCQPSMQMMNYKSIFVPSKKTNNKGKNYKKIRINPPAQLQNKWYFSKDLCKQGLLLLTCTACSLDHYFISTQAESNSLSFFSLNTNMFKMHNFQQPPAYSGYSPYTEGTTEKHLWATQIKILPSTDLKTIEFGQLVYLAETKIDQEGMQISQANSIQEYFANWKNWGNPFRPEYLTTPDHILVTTKPLHYILTKYTNKTDKLNSKDNEILWTILTEPLLYECRYTPDRDTGKNTIAYILSTIRDTTFLDPPHKEEFKISGFPIWLLLFGWLDWQRNLKEATNLDRSYMLVLQSEYINPHLPYYVFIDDDFEQGKSPYIPHDKQILQTDTDRQNWFPCTLFQHQTIEKLISCGPGTAKIEGKNSVEAKCEYKFVFKFGGCPPKTEQITDPCEQTVYPIPGDQQNVYSLQNPNIPPETFIWHFDTKRDMLTATAEKRIKTDHSSGKSLFSTTGKMQLEPAISTQTPETSETETEDSEKEEETLLQQLHKQRLKRKRLQRKLLKLMSST